MSAKKGGTHLVEAPGVCLVLRNDGGQLDLGPSIVQGHKGEIGEVDELGGPADGVRFNPAANLK